VSCISATVVPPDAVSPIANNVVLAPYRAQLTALADAVTAAAAVGDVDALGVQSSTIDSYQGLDADAVVLSFLVGEGSGGRGGGAVGPLLGEWRRVNVGLSRARPKLVLVVFRLRSDATDTYSDR